MFPSRTATTAASRLATRCVRCQLKAQRRPVVALQSQRTPFTTSAVSYARRAPGSRSSANTSDGAEEASDRRKIEFAERILDDVFAAGKGKKQRRGAELSDIGEEAREAHEAKPEIKLAGKARRKLDEEKLVPQREIEESLPDHVAWGRDALPKVRYAEFGIETADQRAQETAKAETNHEADGEEGALPNDPQQLENSKSEPAESDDWYVDQVYNQPEEQLRPSDFVPLWMRGADIAAKRSQGLDAAEEKLEETGKGPLRLSEVVAVLKAERAMNMVVLDMREKCDYTDYMVIVEGRSKKQLYAIADAVRRRAKHRIPYDLSLPPTMTIEGSDSDDWMVMDLGRFMIHVFTPEARAAYNLEGLWTAIRDPLLELSSENDL